jgi:hypothetical protein
MIHNSRWTWRGIWKMFPLWSCTLTAITVNASTRPGTWHDTTRYRYSLPFWGRRLSYDAGVGSVLPVR